MTYLYVIAHPEGWRKIGRASEPIRRFKQHQRFCGQPLTGEAIFKCDDPVRAERQALDTLARYRIMGEWFKVDLETALLCLEKVTGSSALAFPPFQTSTSRSRPSAGDILPEREVLARMRATNPSLTLTEMYERLAGDEIELWFEALPEPRRTNARGMKSKVQQGMRKMAEMRRQNGVGHL